MRCLRSVDPDLLAEVQAVRLIEAEVGLRLHATGPRVRAGAADHRPLHRHVEVVDAVALADQRRLTPGPAEVVQVARYPTRHAGGRLRALIPPPAGPLAEHLVRELRR